MLKSPSLRQVWPAMEKSGPLFWFLAALAVSFALAPEQWTYLPYDGFLEKIGSLKPLIHGIHDDSFSAGMPLSSLALSFLEPRGPHLLWPAIMLVSALLMFSLGCMLHSRPAGALFVVLFFRHGAGDFWFFELEQKIYGVTLLLVANAMVLRAASPGLRTDMTLGIALGISLLTRSPLFLFPFVAVAADLLGRRAARPRKSSLAIIVIPLLTLLPWVTVNWFVHSEWVLFEKDRAACNMVTGALGIVPTLEGDFRELAGIADHEDPVRWAVRRVITHPVVYAVSVVKRLWYIVLLFPVLSALWLAGLLIGRKDEKVRRLSLLIAYFIVVHCLMSVERRYMLPVLPLMGAVGLLAVVRMLRPKADQAAQADGAGFFHLGLVPPGLMCLYSLFLVCAYPARVHSRQADIIRRLETSRDDWWLLREAGKDRLLDGDTDKALRYLARALRLSSLPSVHLEYAKALLIRNSGGRDLIERPGFRDAVRRLKDPGMHLLTMLSRLEREDYERALESHRQAIGMIDSGLGMRGPETEFQYRMSERLKTAGSRLTEGRLQSMLLSWPEERRAVLLKRFRRISPLPDGTEDPLSPDYAGSERRTNLPSAEAVLHGKAMDLQAARRYASALAVLDELVSSHPENAGYLVDRGVLKALLFRRPEAIADLEEALTMAPELSSAYISLAAIHISENRREDALKVCSAALAAEKLDSRGGEFVIRKEYGRLALEAWKGRGMGALRRLLGLSGPRRPPDPPPARSQR